MPGIPKFREESHPERAVLKRPGTKEDQFFHISRGVRGDHQFSWFVGDETVM
jgi:hypothetical protein